MQRLNGEDFFLVEKIKEGYFAEVFLGRSIKNGEVVAMKRIAKDNGDSRVRKESFNQEIKTAIVLENHPSLAKVLGYFETIAYYWLVMEFVEGMDLVKVMERQKFVPFSEGQCMPILQQIVGVLSYAHSKGVAHLDIKLDNIMLQPNGTIKIIDWGLSCSEDSLCCKKTCGSPEYTAPEVYNRPANIHYNAFQSDVFSLGVTLYCILVGEYPFDETALYLMRGGLEANSYTIPKNVCLSEKAIHLLDRMFTYNPENRITLDQINDHPWLQKIAQ